MAATEIVAVLDAGPLIHLDELGRLGLLSDFKQLLVPQAVMDEALRHRPGMNPDVLSNMEIISHPPPLPADLLKLADEFALHAGERAALAAGFQTHGTIGLILRSQRRGRVSKTEMLQLLRDLPARTTLHIHKDFLAVIVARAETEAIS
jgi:predicted nucleic acid-binding protein